MSHSMDEAAQARRLLPHGLCGGARPGACRLPADRLAQGPRVLGVPRRSLSEPLTGSTIIRQSPSSHGCRCSAAACRRPGRSQGGRSQGGHRPAQRVAPGHQRWPAKACVGFSRLLSDGTCGPPSLSDATLPSAAPAPHAAARAARGRGIPGAGAACRPAQAPGGSGWAEPRLSALGRRCCFGPRCSKWQPRRSVGSSRADSPTLDPCVGDWATQGFVLPSGGLRRPWEGLPRDWPLHGRWGSLRPFPPQPPGRRPPVVKWVPEGPLLSVS